MMRMMKLKKMFVLLLAIQFLFPSLAFSITATDISGCRTNNPADTYTRLCQNVDDIVCKDTPDRLRRSCNESDKTIVHAGMTANEVYQLASGCLKSAAHSFVAFFTEFLPELVKAIWDLSQDVYHSVTSPGLIDSIKGAYESARSIAADTYEAINKNPGAFFSNIWNKITEAVGPMVANYDCLKPQAKVEKICGLVSEWVMPPVILAKVIVKGGKAAKELVELNLMSKYGKQNAKEVMALHESRLKLSLKEYQAMFKQYSELGYTLEDFKLMKIKGTLGKIDFKNLKSISTPEGLLQYATLTGKKGTKTLPKKPEAIPALGNFKKQYAKELKLKVGANGDFLLKMEKDALTKNSQVLYFDVENSVQKTLNDTIFVDKTAVDAINNSFFEKFYANVKNSPELLSRLDGEYKDYKSFRLRLSLKPGDDPKKYESLLSELYKKSNNDFASDLSNRKITQNIPPRTDGLGDARNWFLAGSGVDSLEANMAARAARNSRSTNNLSRFRDHIPTLNLELNEIEKLRSGLAGNASLKKLGLIEELPNGKSIPSKSMIGILRKIKPSDFSTPEEYIAKIRGKSQEIFGLSLDDQTIINFTDYFKKVDSMSPPLFSAERVVIDLDKAKHGIVSVDFAGVGVENIYQQMKGLSDVDLKNPNIESTIKSGFKKMQAGVDQVSEGMNKAKETFSRSTRKTEGALKSSPQFSGDDGIYMPAKNLNPNEKLDLIMDLAGSEDPSKYRVTFVSSHFPDGKAIPSSERSKRIVRAETVEKDIRAKIIGMDKIPDADAKKFITAIDYVPNETGGIFNLIVGGGKLSDKEKDIIRKSFKSTLSKEKGEKVGEIIFETNLFPK